MTTNPNNPFVLPGLGQTGEMASNPLFASLEMMRQTFSTLSGANGLTKGLAMQPTLDPAELEKKINELKSVESWLKLNLSMLSSTIQGMEVQLATITTLQQFMSANSAATKDWSQSAPATASPTPPADDKPLTESVDNNAAQAWWNMLTQQFGQLAAATTASMEAASSAKTPSASKAMQSPPKEKSASLKTAPRKRASTKKPIVRTASKK
jgi:hypothetical protein